MRNSYGPALRRADVENILRRTGNPGSGRKPRGGVRRPRGADRENPAEPRATDPGDAAGYRSGVWRRELNFGGGARVLETADSRRPRGSGAAEFRPQHAGRGKPRGDGSIEQPAFHAFKRWRPEPQARGHSRRANSPRGQRDD